MLQTMGRLTLRGNPDNHYRHAALLLLRKQSFCLRLHGLLLVLWGGDRVPLRASSNPRLDPGQHRTDCLRLEGNPNHSQLSGAVKRDKVHHKIHTNHKQFRTQAPASCRRSRSHCNLSVVWPGCSPLSRRLVVTGW